MNPELARRIALSQARGVNISNVEALIERAGGFDRLIAAMPPQRRSVAEAEVTFIEKNGIDALYYECPDFPRRLLDCEDAPVMLYRLGRCDLNARHVVAIVGTRNATIYGHRFTADLVAGLAKRLDSLVIVSGLAYGIDVQAHRAALDNRVPTVGVVAHGLTTLYPADHRSVAARMVAEGGAIVTEYLSGAPIHRGNFLARNRIVAGLADVVVLVESDIKGGAMVTANIADGYNRDVCVAPGRVTDRYSAGPNALLVRRKASPIRDADDLIELMNWTPAAQASAPELPFVELSEEKMRIIEYLRSHPESTLDDLARDLGVPYPAMSARMMEMEMDDLVECTPGGTYMILRK